MELLESLLDKAPAPPCNLDEREWQGWSEVWGGHTCLLGGVHCSKINLQQPKQNYKMAHLTTALQKEGITRVCLPITIVCINEYKNITCLFIYI